MQLANPSSSITRSLTCVCVLVLVVTTAYPLDSRNIAQYANLPQFLLRGAAIQHSLHNVYRLRNAVDTSKREKRYGIAGLDNIDMITSTLDKVRHHNRRPLLSVSLTNADLQRLLNAGR